MTWDWTGADNQKWKIAEAPGCVASGIADARKPAKRVMPTRIPGKARTFDLSGRRSGLYCVQIGSDHVMVTEKIAFTH